LHHFAITFPEIVHLQFASSNPLVYHTFGDFKFIHYFFNGKEITPSRFFVLRILKSLFSGVTYRHIVLSLPEKLRLWFYRNANLLSDLMRAGYACLIEDIVVDAFPPERPGGLPLIEGCIECGNEILRPDTPCRRSSPSSSPHSQTIGLPIFDQ
jgi:hypothetical protein